MLKRKDFRYEIGKRSNSWLKVIKYQYDDCGDYGLRNILSFLLSFLVGKPAGLMEFMPVTNEITFTVSRKLFKRMINFFLLNRSSAD
ncbi:hypothetical protein CN481_14235 [Bacillus sp. AFS006103]|nr:hypothetical protein CN481_14235 [Bacillus sp. AFS006103]